MASSSSSSLREKHDVFISFRGEDTRSWFASFLYEELRRNQIQAYMDDRELETGDEIPQKLMDAIEESKISIIIFSENYATSTWCLNEIVKILECKKRNGQIVIPVFYRIDPSIVRKQKEGYAVAFAKLEVHFKDEMEKVNQWKEALKDAADLSGLDSKLFRNGPMLVQKIVNDIWSQLRRQHTSNHPYKGLCGIQECINNIECLLSIGSPDARIIGICNMTGSGKTTLANAIFQKLYLRFEGGCFLPNVREASAGHRLDELRNKLLSKLFKDRAILSVDTPSLVSPFIGDKFRRKKVLIVLDDVDCSSDVEALIYGYEEFAHGCRIIVTTRDAQVLNNVTDHIYKLKMLNYTESIELFQLHAFKNKPPPEEFKELSIRVASYAGGNPFALIQLGNRLQYRGIRSWRSYLTMLERNMDRGIQNHLRESYEGLNDMLKDLFLDIACFFACSWYNRFTRADIKSIQGSYLGVGILNEKF